MFCPRRCERLQRPSAACSQGMAPPHGARLRSPSPLAHTPRRPDLSGCRPSVALALPRCAQPTARRASGCGQASKLARSWRRTRRSPRGEPRGYFSKGPHPRASCVPRNSHEPRTGGASYRVAPGFTPGRETGTIAKARASFDAWPRMRSITSRSLMTAMKRMRPPQPVHVSASTPRPASAGSPSRTSSTRSAAQPRHP